MDGNTHKVTNPKPTEFFCIQIKVIAIANQRQDSQALESFLTAVIPDSWREKKFWVVYSKKIFWDFKNHYNEEPVGRRIIRTVTDS